MHLELLGQVQEYVSSDTLVVAARRTDVSRSAAATMSQYLASIPADGQVRQEIQTFFEKFFTISDTPGAHDEYANYFTKNGTLIMGPAETSGRDGECLQASAQQTACLLRPSTTLLSFMRSC